MRRRRRARHGFTLIELLVVLVIIGILAALLIPAIAAAVVRAKEAAVLSEINNLAVALEQFRSKYGQYPPSRVVLSETGDYSAITLGPASPLANRTLSLFRQMWPRFQASQSGSPGRWYDFNGDGAVSAPVVIQGDECLVFFLGGVPKRIGTGWAVTGFAMDPANPFQSEATARNRSTPIHPFDSGRLLDLDGDGFPSYVDSFGGASSPAPLVYFSSYDGVGYDPDDCNIGEPGGTYPIALGVFQASNAATGKGTVPSRPDLIASPGPNPYTSGPPAPSIATNRTQTVWVRPQSFQILFAGRDRLFGIGGQYDAQAGTTLPFDPALELLIAGQTLDSSVRQTEVDNGSNFAGGRLGP